MRVRVRVKDGNGSIDDAELRAGVKEVTHKHTHTHTHTNTHTHTHTHTHTLTHSHTHTLCRSGGQST